MQMLYSNRVTQAGLWFAMVYLQELCPLAGNVVRKKVLGFTQMSESTYRGWTETVLRGQIFESL